MKLWYSFSKELILSSKGWYFYVELFMALLLLAILLFAIPEDFESKGKQYFYLDLPQVIQDRYKKGILEEDLDEIAEQVELEADKETLTALLYETDESKIYILDSKEALDAISESERVPTVHVRVNDNQQIVHTYYLQGYETEKLVNIIKMFQNRLAGHDVIMAYSDDIEIRRLYQDAQPLSDKENMIPVFLTFNGSLMSLFVIAAYIFVDKDEGIIKAYAITASSVWHYLFSKIGVTIVTSIFTTLIITVPVMGQQPNYPAMLLFLIASSFFVASLGLLIATFFDDIIEAFGSIYIIIMVMILPNISYFTPSWDPDWIKIIPTYVMLQSFKEIVSVGGNIAYVMVASLAFVMLGAGIFVLANYRFKKTLSS